MHAHQLRASGCFKGSLRLLPLPATPFFSPRKALSGQVWCREKWVPCHSKRGGRRWVAPGWPRWHPHQGGPCSGWKECRTSITPPSLSISCFCFFQAKPGKGPSRSISITACCFIPARVQGLQGYLRRTLSERGNEKGRIPSAWKGLRAPLFLALSSLSFSYQASTLVAAELWLLMWVASRRVVYYVLLRSVQESVTLKQRSCDTERYIFSHWILSP